MNVLLDNLDLYASAFVGTIQLFLVAAIGSLVVGLLLAAMRVSPVPVLRGLRRGLRQHRPQHPVDAGLLLLRLRLPAAGDRRPVVLRPCLPRADRLHRGVRLRGRAFRGEHGAGRAGRGVPGLGFTFGQTLGRSSCRRRCGRWCRR